MLSLRHIYRNLLLSSGVVCAATVALVSVAPASLASADTEQEAPTTLRRLTETQYRNAISDIFGSDIKVLGGFEPDLRVHGLLAVGSSAVSVTPGGLERYEYLARGIAAQVTDPAHRDKLIGCAPAAADPKGQRCAEAVVTKIGLQLYRRPLPPKEAQALAAFTVSASQQLGDFHAGMAATLAAMLSSPRFLFRVEETGKAGAVDAYSKASRLSFFLWNTTPDAALLAAAKNGAIDTPDGLAREVDRMIASSRLADGVRALFSDYLQLDTMDTLSKDAQIFPAFTTEVAAAAREQTLRTITDLLIARQGDFRNLFTTHRFAMTRALGPIYDIPISRPGWYIHEFPASDPRVGLLSHASLLALHSHPGRTSPTLRGKAIQEALLCNPVPSPPANVNFAVVQDVSNATLKTTRMRLQAHLDNPVCAGCHRITDPIGLGLEQFDGAGQFRTHERGEAIDVTGEFEGKAFDGAAGIGKIFHDSPSVSACFVETVWRYATGREVGRADEPLVEGLTERFATDKYRLAPLLKAIVLDPRFYRSPAVTAAGSSRTASAVSMREGGKS